MNAHEPTTEEQLAGDDRQIANLLGALPRVDAPKDFDFRLKARIAKGRTSPALGPFSLPVWVKFAAPAALLLLVGILFVTLSGRDAGTDRNEITAQAAAEKPAGTTAPLIAAAPDIASVQPEAAPPVDVAQPAPPARAAIVQRTSMRKVSPARPAPDTNDGGGSIDRAVRGTSTTILPRGISITPVNTAVTPQGFDTASKVSVSDVFSQLGIDAEYSNGWVVKTVRDRSVAGTAGLRSGDVIEAVDGKPISEVDGKRGFNGRVLTVRRGDQSVKLTLVQ